MIDSEMRNSSHSDRSTQTNIDYKKELCAKNPLLTNSFRLVLGQYKKILEILITSVLCCRLLVENIFQIFSSPIFSINGPNTIMAFGLSFLE